MEIIVLIPILIQIWRTYLSRLTLACASKFSMLLTKSRFYCIIAFTSKTRTTFIPHQQIIFFHYMPVILILRHQEFRQNFWKTVRAKIFEEPHLEYRINWTGLFGPCPGLSLCNRRFRYSPPFEFNCCSRDLVSETFCLRLLWKHSILHFKSLHRIELLWIKHWQ